MLCAGPRQRLARAEPVLRPMTGELWYVGEDWRPPICQPGWPDTGKIPFLTIPEYLLAYLKPSGRPRKRM